MLVQGVIYVFAFVAAIKGLFLKDLFKSSVCYDTVGCFNNSDPFTNAWNELPDSPDKIGVTFTLFTRDGPTQGHALDYKKSRPMEDTTFDPEADIKMIIHGYVNDGTEDWNKNLTKHLLLLKPFNVIRVAWGPGAFELYPKAAANTRVVGASAAILLTSLRDRHGVSMERVHLLGHSLGSHVAGYIGARVRGIGRISGMDPAGPLFESVDPQVRLDPTDALFVDCIHSDGLPLTDLGFGTMSAWCHADFYPNGGRFQPGCPPVVRRTLGDLLTFRYSEAEDSVSCSHSRSHDLYISSINTCLFLAYPCDSYDDYIAGKCGNSIGGDGGPASMGYHSADSRRHGKFFLDTTGEYPFCGQR
ncbi:inactive pancreatic lipase-related protein 1-like isoform X2 [Pomacea canaliculata]|uniref:inactive pancreatic lipase-related protein 1-like isoform X2 n=1 Tax=Pomacea canaliculata TaxID=400727 RepID=UPI000D737396|nr:inactive pancreatic lipase-related protein 1-like isoform X2 [Pomacea canaliculata]